MLKELSIYENLGTPAYFWELFSQINGTSKKWNRRNVQEYFFNRIVGGESIFDGCVPFAEAIGSIHINQDGFMTIDDSLVGFLIDEKYLQNKLLERLFLSLAQDADFHNIFCSEHISYDIIYKSIQINNSAFPFKFSNFRKLLLNFNFLFPHPDKQINKLIINQKYKKFFDFQILPQIKNRKLGVAELEGLLERKQIFGEEAEDFVLSYEKQRLSDHHNIDGIEKISQYDVAAGYDIVSYNRIDSQERDRFIEVKSFSGTPNFFWSRNEIEVARIRKKSYFLYLVDRNQIKNQGYAPLIIQNPYIEIMDNRTEWERRVEGYFISKKQL